jgi:hypothetical protein
MNYLSKNTIISKSYKTVSSFSAKYYKKVITTIILVLVTISLFYGVKYAYNKLSGKIEIISMKRPFLNTYAVKSDGTEIMTNIVLITHAFTRDECEVQYYEALDKNMHFLGCSSYSEFPDVVSNPHDVLHDPKIKAHSYDYCALTRGWLHCFRNPDKYIKCDKPQALISESDFGNYEGLNPDSNVKKEYDFIYICLKDGDKKEGDKDCPQTWQSFNRNWDVAKKCLEIMCKKGYKSLLVGRIGCNIPSKCEGITQLTDFMPYHEFIKCYNKARAIFLPNTTDASPRCETEAMCHDLPALTNEDLLGGWKYVESGVSGEFFKNDMSNFESVLDTFMNNLNSGKYKARDHFIKNWGKYNSGRKFKEFVGQVFKPAELNFKLEEIDYIKPGV